MKWYLIVLKKYVEFNGRARRSEYWYFFLFNFLVSFAIDYWGAMTQNRAFGTIYFLAVLIPGIAVSVRRMHDTGKSGWYILIPIYGLILACTDGNQGPNKYGADPKRPELPDEIDQVGMDLQTPV